MATSNVGGTVWAGVLGGSSGLHRRSVTAPAGHVHVRSLRDVAEAVIEDWLADAPEADWELHLLRLATRGALGHAGAWMLDLPALAQPYACNSATCTPGQRRPRDRSCCADLEVGVTAAEQAAIEAVLPAVEALMADDPRWKGRPALFDDGALRRPGRRCVFARLDGGLRCSLHDLGAKPLPCRLFPLAVVDLGSDQRLLTAVHRSTARALQTYAASRFPCLGTGPSLVESERDTLRVLMPARTAATVQRVVNAWRDANASPEASVLSLPRS